ncbi:MAG: peptidylprolyl isomerase [Clostridia bacterium]|nr:peptidylprolyl isomerase [Clostridia bacterium]
MDKILAKVGALTVTENEVNEFLAELGARAQGYNTPEGRRAILEEIIGSKLLLLDARHNLLETEPEFKAELAKLRENLLINYAGNKIITAVKVSDEDVKKYYEDNIDRFKQGETVNADHILVDSEEKALEIFAKIQSGEVSFADAAREYSSCPSGQRGGNLGDFGRGQMVPEFDKAVFELEVGQVTEVPVQTQFGYHLIKLNSKSDESVMSFEQIAPQLKDMVLGEKRREAYEKRINQLKILYPVELI